MIKIAFRMIRHPMIRHPHFLLVLVVLAWIGNGLYAIGGPGGALKFWSPALVAPAMIGFLYLHGSQRYGHRLIGQFLLIVFSIGWTFESLSLVSGVPFGNYHYTEVMAPFLGRVPVFVLPAYGIMGYACWSLATLLCGQRGAGIDRAGLIAVPMVAASLMVAWDLSMDPLRATVEQRWIWTDGGPHLGIPVLNYLGWLLINWLMFQIFAKLVFLAKPGQSTDRWPAAWWLSVPMIYLSFPVEYLLNPLLNSNPNQGVLVNGIAMPLQTLFAEVALLCAMTMVPVAAIGVLCVWNPSILRNVMAAKDSVED